MVSELNANTQGLKKARGFSGVMLAASQLQAIVSNDHAQNVAERGAEISWRDGGNLANTPARRS